MYMLCIGAVALVMHTVVMHAYKTSHLLCTMKSSLIVQYAAAVGLAYTEIFILKCV